MFGRSSKRLIRAIATLCVAIMCVFCIQTIVIAQDRLEHALEIEHDANPVAGTVQYCAATPDACGQSGEPTHPISHAHTGDTASNILLTADPASLLIEFTITAFSFADAGLGHSIGQRAPDRPPKA